MLILVLGGSSSGKSRLGEAYCAALGTRRVYIATMHPADDKESRLRIGRHQTQRAAYGFDTVEWYHSLHSLTLQTQYDTAILECMGNLVANEMFQAGTPSESLVDMIMTGIGAILRQTGNLVVISNQVFGESKRYTGEMADYMQGLGRLNCRIAAAADIVVESVCGLPLIHKGKGIQP